MYQDLIRNELNEAAETLANFLKDDANIHAIQRAAVLLADSFKAGGKVLSRYVDAVGREGDVLLGISTSGNSGNVIKAIAAAREKGMKVITLKNGGNGGY